MYRGKAIRKRSVKQLPWEEVAVIKKRSIFESAGSLFLFCSVVVTGVALCMGFSFAAPPLTVEKGLSSHQVFQARDGGGALIEVSGPAPERGTIQARITEETGHEILPWANVGMSDGKAWKATVVSVPVGGPYTVELRLVDARENEIASAVFEQVFVGDLWVLAGQSNMQGVGNREDCETPHPKVQMLGLDDVWRTAEEPLHYLAEAVDPALQVPKDAQERERARADKPKWKKGAGLGLTFAKEMVERTGRPVGLIPCALGGSSIVQWDPKDRDKGGESLYGAMVRRIRLAGGKVRGVLWYQGESDAHPERLRTYRDAFRTLVTALRSDVGDPNLPVFFVQISRFVTDNADPVLWSGMRMEQLHAEVDLPNVDMVAAIDLPLDDLIHIGTPGLKVLGYRLANVAQRHLYGGNVTHGPRFETAVVEKGPYGQYIRVVFRDVNGALKASGRLHGFSVSSGAEGADVPVVYRQDVDPANPTHVRVWITKLPEDPHLWYGRGLDPYCNLVDEANMAAPAFGPVPVSVPPAEPVAGK